MHLSQKKVCKDCRLEGVSGCDAGNRTRLMSGGASQDGIHSMYTLYRVPLEPCYKPTTRAQESIYWTQFHEFHKKLRSSKKEGKENGVKDDESA